MLRQAWVTEFDKGLVSLSLESNRTMPEYERVRIREMIYPENIPLENRRHVLMVSLFDDRDLMMIRDAINKYLGGA